MGPKILVVDDDDGSRKVLEVCLKHVGYEHDVAEGVDQAIELMETGDYDIMLVDKNMRSSDGTGRGGMELLWYVQVNKPEIQSIMITGYPSVESAVEALRFGAFDYLQKPFTKDDLVAKINKLWEYQSSVNPDNIIGVHKRTQDQIVEILEKAGDLSEDEIRDLLNAVDENMTAIVHLQNDWERIIFAQRETLARVGALAEQLSEAVTDDDNVRDLAEKIAQAASRRI